jgi:hypothetical protein
MENVQNINLKSPIIKHPPRRANQTLAFGKKYEGGTILGISSTFTGSHTLAVADVWSATHPIPVGIIADYGGKDLTGETANKLAIIGVGETELDYEEAVRLNPYLSTIPGVMNAPLNQQFTNIHITKRVK